MLQKEICRKIFNLGRARQRTLVYLILKQTPAEAHYSACLYGVGIRICETGEEAYISSLSTSRREAYRIIDILATANASPADIGSILRRRKSALSDFSNAQSALNASRGSL